MLRRFPAPEDAVPMPANTQAEAAVLSIILAHPQQMEQIADTLRSEHFMRDDYRTIYEVLVSLHTRHKRCTPFNALHELDVRGSLEAVAGLGYDDPHRAVEDILDDLANHPHSVKDIHDMAHLVIHTSNCRDYIRFADQLREKAFHQDEDIVSFVESTQDTIALGITTDTVTDLSDALDRYLRDYVNRVQDFKAGKTSGIPMGFPDLDRLLGGFRRSRLYILAGTTGGGKTAFALNIGLNMISHSRRVLMFSLEMDEDELVQRLLSMETHIDQSFLRDGDVTDREDSQVKAAVARLRDMDLRMDDRTYTLAAIRNKARAEHRKRPLDLIVVDYLGLIEPEEGGAKKREQQRYLEMGELSRGLKRLARELKVPILALAQLNRAADNANEPQLGHLYESSKLAQDSDVVMFAHIDASQEDNRNQSKPYRVTMIVRKHRNGRIGKEELWFRPRLTKFEPKEWGALGGQEDVG